MAGTFKQSCVRKRLVDATLSRFVAPAIVGLASVTGRWPELTVIAPDRGEG